MTKTSGTSTTLQKGLNEFGRYLGILLSVPSRPVLLVFLALFFFISTAHVLRRKNIRLFSLLKMKTSYNSMLLCTVGTMLYFTIGWIGYIVYVFVTNNHSNDKFVARIYLGVAALLLICPFDILCREARKNFFDSFFEIAIGRYKKHHIPFSLVILADIFTSYSFFIGCLLGLLPFQTIPILLRYLKTLPLIFRVRQCLQDYYGSRATRHLMNTLKYLLGIATGILFDTYEFDPSLSNSKKTTIIATVASSAFLSLGWDLFMDWNMNIWGFRTYSLPSHGTSTSTLSTQSDSVAREPVENESNEVSDEEAGIVKKDIGKMGRFSSLFYFTAIVYDIFGRMLNVFKALAYLDSCRMLRPFFAHNLGILFALIEAFRRFIWTIIRIENYHSQLLYLEANK